MAAQAEIKAVITAEDRASATVDKFGKNVNKTSLGIGIAVAAVGAATLAFGVDSVKAFSESERASKQLEHAVIDVTHATREQLRQTEDLAEALSRKGVLDDDAIKAGLAQLSTFGLSNKAVQNLGGSLADLAVNQFGVNASSEQLSDTANMLAKALNGQFGILEKSGIRFTEAQKAIIEFGTEEQKVQAINEGFAQNLKYTNEIAAQTSEGAIARLNVQLGNLQERIGGVIATAMTPFINNLTIWIEKNPVLAERIALVVLGLGTLTVALWATNTAVNVLTVSFGGLFGRIAGVVSAVAILYAQFVAVANGATHLGNSLQGLGNSFNAAWYRATQMGGVLGWLNGLIYNINASAYNLARTLDNLIHKIPILGAILPRLPELNFQGRASGGPVNSGTPYIVGEQGPELFVPKQSGTIVPNGQTPSSGTSNTTININVGMMTGSAVEQREAAMRIFENLQDIANTKGQSVAQLIGSM